MGGSAENDAALPKGAQGVRGDDMSVNVSGGKDGKDHVDAGKEEDTKKSLSDDESTIVERRDGEKEQRSRKRSGEENLDVLASIASQAGKGVRKHHLLRHTLDSSKIGENAVQCFDGAKDVEEALAMASTMSQKELQRTFSKIYGVSSSSNNNNWLRKKLMEALAPSMWKEAWDRYMDEPFSNRGKKDRLRKEREAQELKEKKAKSAKCGAFNDLRPLAAQQEGLGHQGMISDHYQLVPPNQARHMQYQVYPNDMQMPSSYGRGQIQDCQKELVKALNTTSKLLVQYMSGRQYPPSHPGGYAPYQQHQPPYADSIYANSGYHGAGMYGQNQMYDNVPYSGIPTRHPPGMHEVGNTSLHMDVTNRKNASDSMSKEHVIAMLKYLVNNRSEEEEQAAKNDANKKQSCDDKTDVVVPAKEKDLAGTKEDNAAKNLWKKVQDTTCNDGPSKEEATNLLLSKEHISNEVTKGQQSNEHEKTIEAQTQFFGSPLRYAQSVDAVSKVKEDANRFGPLPGSTFPADKMMFDLLTQWLKDK